MKKSGAEKANLPVDQPSFDEFRAWLRVKGYSNYLTFVLP